ncbi:hypothetical protein D9M71_676220 [compost metagenome]
MWHDVHQRLVLFTYRPLEVAGGQSTDVLRAAADHDIHLIDHDLLGGDGHRHQPGGALPIDSGAGDVHAHSGT